MMSSDEESPSLSALISGKKALLREIITLSKEKDRTKPEAGSPDFSQCFNAKEKQEQPRKAKSPAIVEETSDSSASSVESDKENKNGRSTSKNKSDPQKTHNDDSSLLIVRSKSKVARISSDESDLISEDDADEPLPKTAQRRSGGDRKVSDLFSDDESDADEDEIDPEEDGNDVEEVEDDGTEDESTADEDGSTIEEVEDDDSSSFPAPRNIGNVNLISDDDDYSSFAGPISMLKGPASKKMPPGFMSSTVVAPDVADNISEDDSPSSTSIPNSSKKYSSEKSPFQSPASPAKSENDSSKKSSFASAASSFNETPGVPPSNNSPSEVVKKPSPLSNYRIPKLPSAKTSPTANDAKPESTPSSTFGTKPNILKTHSERKPTIGSQFSSSINSNFKHLTSRTSPSNSTGNSTSTFAVPNLANLKISEPKSLSKPSDSSTARSTLSQSSSSLSGSSSFQSVSSGYSASGIQNSSSNSSIKQQGKVKEIPIWNAKMPSAGFNLNEMGKKALETHRVQQSLTMDCLRRIHKSMSTMPDESVLMSDPKTLKSDVELMPHQKHALAWLLWRESQKPHGGILADDMGLGKTLTMISLILKNQEIKEEAEENGQKSSSTEDSDGEDWASSGSRPKKYPGGTLVIAPASLLSQWEGEVKKRVKSNVLNVLIHHGAKREEKARRLARYDMVVTTYGTVTSEGKKMEDSALYKIAWDRIIIDEAHTIRNPKTAGSIAVCNLTARNRWALTGTPIHNKQLDMYGLLKFLRCKPFDDLAVWKRWVDNRDAAGTKRLNTVVKSILLRRTKEQLLTSGANKLPPKNYKKIEVALDNNEKEVYHKLLLLSSSLFHKYLAQRAEKADLQTYGIVMSKKKHVDLEKNEELLNKHPELANLYQKFTGSQDVKAHQILVFILRLRQLCCHPSLISEMIDKEAISADGIEEGGLDIDFMDQFKRMSLKPNAVDQSDDDTEASSKYLTSDHPLFSRDRISSKIRKVIEILDEEILPTEDKVVIVSQWAGYLAILGEVLRKKGIRYGVLTGEIAIPDRGPIIEKFNTPDRGPRILLLSLTAGGCGLNLVGGNRLMLIDIHWNPQLENQACDRIYRVGQKKDVFVYRFVVSDTIEEAIEKIQQTKLNVADQVLTGAKKINAAKLTLDDMKLLFNLDPLQAPQA
ncbi:unnamed protein product [Bemisia tabaci]|uniref:Transcription termination factor 2 n=2 Tax=Bemisia tabaci TaxID=7038 RepID=A0A9P0AEU2_BEMTA|nr:unnamed protein product [Bemisia tabaci]